MLSQIRNFVLQNNHARHYTHARGVVSGISPGVVVSFVCLFDLFNSDKNILDFQTINDGFFCRLSLYCVYPT